jgi:hypothetical protein
LTGASCPTSVADRYQGLEVPQPNIVTLFAAGGQLGLPPLQLDGHGLDQQALVALQAPHLGPALNRIDRDEAVGLCAPQ